MEHLPLSVRVPIENDNLRTIEDIKSDIILDYRKELEPLFDRSMFVIDNLDLGQLVKNVNNIKISFCLH